MSNQFSYQPISEITVQELANRLADTSNPCQLIDVRERVEVELARIEGFANFPLSEYESWSEAIQTRLDPEAETLVICHHGMRSAQMCQWLLNQGFTNVKNISGGIDAFSRHVDPTVPRY